LPGRSFNRLPIKSKFLASGEIAFDQASEVHREKERGHGLAEIGIGPGKAAEWGKLRETR
jgi:hypothetical protein